MSEKPLMNKWKKLALLIPKSHIFSEKDAVRISLLNYIQKDLSSISLEEIKREVWDARIEWDSSCGHDFENTKYSESDWSKMRCMYCFKTIVELLDKTSDLALKKLMERIMI